MSKEKVMSVGYGIILALSPVLYKKVAEVTWENFKGDKAKKLRMIEAIINDVGAYLKTCSYLNDFFVLVDIELTISQGLPKGEVLVELRTKADQSPRTEENRFRLSVDRERRGLIINGTMKEGPF